MIVGVPKEIKISENRVGMTESGVKQLIREGQKVFVERDAGVGSGISNEEYVKAGATILDTKREVYDRSDTHPKVRSLSQKSTT